MSEPKPKKKRPPKPAVEMRRLLKELGRVVQELRIMVILMRAATASFEGAVLPFKTRKEARQESEQLSLFADALHDVVIGDVQPGCDTAGVPRRGDAPK